MTRARTMYALVLPSLVAGGVLFASAFGGAAPAPPAPPAPPTHPAPPAPPAPPSTPAPGVSVTFHDGKLEMTGVREAVNAHIADAIAKVRSTPALSQKTRDQLIARLEKVRAKIDSRLTRLNVTDLDQLGEQLGDLGSEIADVFDGLDVDINTGDLSKDIMKQLGPQLNGHLSFHIDDDHDAPDVPDPPDVPDADDDDDSGEVDASIAEMGDLALKPDQRAQIAKLRTDIKATVTPARARIDTLSRQLRDALANPSANDAEIAHAIDAISTEEATIRKTRILAWVSARRVLDASQRTKVEAAAKKKSK